MGNRIESIRARKGFYRDNYNRVCVGLLMALLAISLLSGLVIYLALVQPVADFYATSTDGKITRLVSLDSPTQVVHR